MSANWRIRVLLAALPLLLSIDAAAQSSEAADLLLQHSELAHLDGRDRRIRLEVKKATPADTLRRIGKAGRLAIEIEGELPKTPALTATFRDATLEEVLKWFAQEVDVFYRVDPRDRLRVFPSSPGGAP